MKKKYIDLTQKLTNRDRDKIEKKYSDILSDKKKYLDSETFSLENEVEKNSFFNYLNKFSIILRQQVFASIMFFSVLFIMFGIMWWKLSKWTKILQTHKNIIFLNDRLYSTLDIDTELFDKDKVNDKLKELNIKIINEYVLILYNEFLTKKFNIDVFSKTSTFYNVVSNSKKIIWSQIKEIFTISSALIEKFEQNKNSLYIPLFPDNDHLLPLLKHISTSLKNVLSNQNISILEYDNKKLFLTELFNLLWKLKTLKKVFLIFLLIVMFLSVSIMTRLYYQPQQHNMSNKKYIHNPILINTIKCMVFGINFILIVWCLVRTFKFIKSLWSTIIDVFLTLMLLFYVFSNLWNNRKTYIDKIFFWWIYYFFNSKIYFEMWKDIVSYKHNVFYRNNNQWYINNNRHIFYKFIPITTNIRHMFDYTEEYKINEDVKACSIDKINSLKQYTKTLNVMFGNIKINGEIYKIWTKWNLSPLLIIPFLSNNSISKFNQKYSKVFNINFFDLKTVMLEETTFNTISWKLTIIKTLLNRDVYSSNINLWKRCGELDINIIKLTKSINLHADVLFPLYINKLRLQNNCVDLINSIPLFLNITSWFSLNKKKTNLFLNMLKNLITMSMRVRELVYLYINLDNLVLEKKKDITVFQSKINILNQHFFINRLRRGKRGKTNVSKLKIKIWMFYKKSNYFTIQCMNDEILILNKHKLSQNISYKYFDDVIITSDDVRIKNKIFLSQLNYITKHHKNSNTILRQYYNHYQFSLKNIVSVAKFKIIYQNNITDFFSKLTTKTSNNLKILFVDSLWLFMKCLDNNNGYVYTFHYLTIKSNIPRTLFNYDILNLITKFQYINTRIICVYNQNYNLLHTIFLFNMIKKDIDSEDISILLEYKQKLINMFKYSGQISTYWCIDKKNTIIKSDEFLLFLKQHLVTKNDIISLKINLKIKHKQLVLKLTRIMQSWVPSNMKIILGNNLKKVIVDLFSYEKSWRVILSKIYTKIMKINNQFYDNKYKTFVFTKKKHKQILVKHNISKIVIILVDIDLIKNLLTVQIIN